MREPRPILTLAIVAVLVAACGGSSSGATPTAAGGGAGATPTLDTAGGGGGGGATPAPVTGGGGLPAGWDQYGKVHVDITGPTARSVDLGFFPVGSHFGGTAQTILMFTVEGTNSALTVTWTSDQITASYVSEDLTVTGIECTGSNVNIGATTASGSFNCTKVLTVLKSGATGEAGTLAGTFDVHS